METNTRAMKELEKEMAELRNKVSQLRLEKELLEWERGQVEENLERSGEMTEPSRRPDLAVHGEDLRVDSEVKFNVPRSPKHQAETTGYFSEAQTVPMGRNVAFTTPPLQQPRVFPVSSTPLDFHEQQIGFKHPMQSPMPGMMSQSPNVTHVKQQRPLLVPDRYDGKLAWRDFQQHFEGFRSSFVHAGESTGRGTAVCQWYEYRGETLIQGTDYSSRAKVWIS